MSARPSLRTGKFGTKSSFHRPLVVLLLCLVGLEIFSTAFSARAESSGRLAGHGVLDQATPIYPAVDATVGQSLAALKTQSKGNKDKEYILRPVRPDEDFGEWGTKSEPNTWVQIAGGFALLIAIQRIRKRYNHWV